MHSWVFRHRARLRVIYGVADEPAPAARRGPRRLKPSPERAAPTGSSTAPAPGTLQRGARIVTLRPMRRPAG